MWTEASNIRIHFITRGDPEIRMTWHGVLILPRTGEYVVVTGESRRRRVLRVTWVDGDLVEVRLGAQESKV